VFKSVPESCPSCNAVTFVHLDEREELNSVCEELLSLAMSLRMKSDKSQPIESGSKPRTRKQPVPLGEAEDELGCGHLLSR
jgi:hypothetical protein